MANFINRLFGKSEDLKSVCARGAIILDVRQPEEFSGGHVDGAINIPLNQLGKHLADLKKRNQPVITCCRSGARSGMAMATLATAGIEVYNGGAWDSLQRQIK